MESIHETASYDNHSISVRTFFEEIIQYFRDIEQQRMLNISLAIDGSCPDLVTVHTRDLHQIVEKLLQNAIRASESGEVRIFIRYEDDLDSTRGQLMIGIRDSGLGQEQVMLDEVVDNLAAADFTTRLNATLTAESMAGKGSAFKLIVPVERTIEKPPELSATEVADLSTSDQGRQKVLLVEDSPDSALIMKLLLKKLDLDIITAQNGREAVEIIRVTNRENPVDLVLMDMQMPEMNGYEATRILRKRGYSRPIVAVTAHNLDGDFEKCMDAGCTDYIAKPVDTSVFYKKLSSLGLGS